MQLVTVSTHSSIFHSVHKCLAFLLTPQEIKGWYLGEQQHVLGAEEGLWLHPPRFSHAVVTPELQITHILTCAATLLWSRLVLVLSVSQSPHPHSVLLVLTAVHQSYCLNSKCLSMLCKHVYADILWECWYIQANFAHVFTWYVTLYHLNWEE